MAQIPYSIIKNGVVTQTGTYPAEHMHRLQVAPGERIVANAALQIGAKFETTKVKPLGTVIKELQQQIANLEKRLDALEQRKR
jgi:hypothetical protein